MKHEFMKYTGHVTFVKYATNWKQLNFKICKAKNEQLFAVYVNY